MDDATVLGDKFLLGQAIGNLVDNAIAFSPSGGQIEVAIQQKEPRAVALTVADRGQGVPEFALSRVFERFYSLPRPATGQKSTGLGLTFVREVAILHGGEVALVNRAEGGAQATLLLPRQLGRA